MQKSQKEHLYKILVIGDLGVGKTSIIKRSVHQNYSPNYRATIGVDFALKVLNWDADTVVRLQLWDIAGQERFGNMTRVYYREAIGAFIVFDITRPSTFEAVMKWKEDLDSKLTLSNGTNVPAVLLANKCDQGGELLMNNGLKMEQFCKENGFVAWFETSAKQRGNNPSTGIDIWQKTKANAQSKILCGRCFAYHTAESESEVSDFNVSDLEIENKSEGPASVDRGAEHVRVANAPTYLTWEDRILPMTRAPNQIALHCDCCIKTARQLAHHVFLLVIELPPLLPELPNRC
ncbi:RAB38 protein, partial [Polypterus senegalus]